MDSAPLMEGTRSWRVPSGLAMSMASPRLMWAGVIRVGLPSMTSKPRFISGIERRALTRAQPMTWVNETLPPRARDRWLLITMRLSISSFTGTDRTLVAVGTRRLASMFCAVRAGAPRRTVRVGSSTASARLAGSGSFGTGAAEVGCGGRASARGVAWVGADTAGLAGAFGSLLAWVGWSLAWPVGCVVVTADFAGADVEAPLLPLEPRLPEPSPLPESAGEPWEKRSHHTLSTLWGSCWYRSYISSTSHSLAPKSARGSS